jgi:hypothetical protein
VRGPAGDVRARSLPENGGVRVAARLHRSGGAGHAGTGADPGGKGVESPFVGDSEMARRMREVDWAGTPLGPPAGWPPALRTAVELLLRSQLPMYVAAGSRWSLLYNDAYAPMLGARHPDALAAAFADAWPEVWPDLQPVLADAGPARPSSMRTCRCCWPAAAGRRRRGSPTR